MRINFEEIINVQLHKQKIRADAQKIKNEFVGKSTAKQYLDALSDLFLEDIRQTIPHIYEIAQVKLGKISLINKLSKLKKYFAIEFENNFLSEYESILANYNNNGFFSDYKGDFNEYIHYFKEKARLTINNQCEISDYNYRQMLSQSRYNFGIFCTSLVVMFLTLFALWSSSDNKINSDAIDIACSYKNTVTAENFSKLEHTYLSSELKNNTAGWQFWSNDNKKILFSIDKKNDQVKTQLVSDNADILAVNALFTVDIYPDFLILQGYSKGSKSQFGQEEWTFNINRINGEVHGTRWAIDNSLMPYFKKGDILWYINGTCKLLKRDF